jgi:hypothetical protein
MVKGGGGGDGAFSSAVKFQEVESSSLTDIICAFQIHSSVRVRTVQVMLPENWIFFNRCSPHVGQISIALSETRRCGTDFCVPAFRI